MMVQVTFVGGLCDGEVRNTDHSICGEEMHLVRDGRTDHLYHVRPGDPFTYDYVGVVPRKKIKVPS